MTIHRYGLTVAVLFVSANSILSTHPFTLSITPRIQSTKTDQATYTLRISVNSEFAASVYLRAYSPTMPDARYEFSPPRFDAPYTEEVSLSVFPIGAINASSNVVYVVAYNGPAQSIDSCVLVVQPRLSFDVFTEQNSGLPSRNVTGIAHGQSDTLWIATDKGLTRYAHDQWFTYAIPNASKVVLTTGGTPVVLVHQVGVYIVRNDSVILVTLPQHLVGYKPLDIAAATDGSFWVLAAWLLDKQIPVLLHYTSTSTTTYTAENSPFTHENIWCIGVDKQNVLWMGIAEYNTDWFLSFDGMYWKTYSNPLLPSYAGMISSKLYPDPHEGIWHGTIASATHITTTGYRHWKRSDDFSFPGKRPAILAFDSSGTRWVSGMPVHAEWTEHTYTGLIGFADGYRYLINTANSNIPSDRIQALFCGVGTLWAGTDKGLVRIPYWSLTGVDSVEHPTLDKPEQISVYVHPQPAHSLIDVKVSATSQRSHSMFLVNSLGETMISKFVYPDADGSMLVTITVNDLPAGRYTLLATDGITSVSHPIVVLR